MGFNATGIGWTICRLNSAQYALASRRGRCVSVLAALRSEVEHGAPLHVTSVKDNLCKTLIAVLSRRRQSGAMDIYGARYPLTPNLS